MTVISAAGKKLRVVVGVVDSGRGSIEVRTSNIIDIAPGMKNDSMDFLTVLCWIVGRPVGGQLEKPFRFCFGEANGVLALYRLLWMWVLIVLSF